MPALLKWAPAARRLIPLCWLLSIVVSIAACSSWRSAKIPPPLPLLAPAALGQQWQLTQSVAVEPLNGKSLDTGPLAKESLNKKAQNSQPLLAAWSVQQGRMDFAGLTATGQTLMTLGYDGSTFTERYSPLLTIPLPGRDILALIQITYWPAAEIEKALQNSDWQCKETTTGRQLLWHRQLAVDIRITAGNNPDTTHKDADDMTPQHILITHHLLQFRLHIDTLDQVILGTTSQP